MVKQATPELAKLFKRLRKLTKERGAKPALAENLGVHVSLLYDWLAGRYEPGGEVTLLMLQWAEAKEGKPKKTPTRIAAAPGQKAQVKTSKTNEQKDSSQRQR